MWSITTSICNIGEGQQTRYRKRGGTNLESVCQKYERTGSNALLSKKSKTSSEAKESKDRRLQAFTIQLCYAGEAKQAITIGVDEGTRHVGIAIVSQGKVLAKGEVELRQMWLACRMTTTLLNAVAADSKYSRLLLNAQKVSRMSMSLIAMAT